MKLKMIVSIAALFAVTITGLYSQDVAGKVFLMKEALPSTEAENKVRVSQTALDFTIEVDGKDVKFSDLTKDKVVFLNFWGTWCGPCRREIPAIVDIQKEMKDDVVVVGIASEQRGDRDKSKVETFVKINKINYINIMSNPQLQKYYGEIAYGKGSGIKYVPTTFLINKDGFVVDYKNGAHSKADFIKWIKSAM